MPAAVIERLAPDERATGVSARAARDAVLTAAVDEARAAAVEVADVPTDVGEHLGTSAQADRLISHHFACTMRGYRGWHWIVTLARVPRGKVATVCEVDLLPSDESVLAPEWLPWDQRLEPGDIGPGDVLPFRADDPRLEPGFEKTGDPEIDDVAIGELALARARVLSPAGRDAAAQRWYNGDHGPTSRGSRASAQACGSCGFLELLQGSLGQVFGVCTNAWSPDDGTVVSMNHGCGAHSETDAPERPTDWPEPSAIIDEGAIEVVRTTPSVEPTPVEPVETKPVETGFDKLNQRSSVESKSSVEPVETKPADTTEAPPTP
ncbi:Protein of unknown function [Paraoerskovia marina]|uniref:DUF3027 domain-containing protein n=1 Tax=Paraoerskovia marina TaxID=545619 RepID=A0A1H1Q5Y3_9CELL|nr:DUF3027 domain-containing protein [Paraoerskovia marina]SDS18784.1 Protein of unknown function [Paraoerskovia marina]